MYWPHPVEGQHFHTQSQLLWFHVVCPSVGMEDPRGVRELDVERAVGFVTQKSERCEEEGIKVNFGKCGGVGRCRESNC